MIQQTIRQALRGRSQWRGYVEGLKNGLVTFWVYSRQSPDMPVDVVVSVFGQVVSQQKAGEERSDVAASVGLPVSPGGSFSLHTLPFEIKENIIADLAEAQKKDYKLSEIITVKVLGAKSSLPLTGAAAAQKISREQLLKALRVGASPTLAHGAVNLHSLTNVMEVLKNSEYFDAAWYANQYPDAAALKMEPAEHYARIGVLLGRQPSLAFDGPAYLTRYPQVAARGFNPVAHYETWGREGGFQIFSQHLKGATPISSDSPRGEVDVLISCWLGRPETLHDGFAEVARTLRDAGLTYKMLCPPGAVTDHLREIGVDSLIPETYSVNRSANLLSVTAKSVKLDPAFAKEIANSDQAFSGRKFTADQRKRLGGLCGKFYNFWRNYLLQKQVKYFVIWGSTAPTSRIFLRLCHELNIETLVLERGQFPGTLYADSIAQFAYGASLRTMPRVLRHHQAGQETQGTQPSLQEMQPIETWGKAIFSQAPDVSVAPDLIARITAHKAGGGKVIVAFGGNDQGSGLRTPKLGLGGLAWSQSSAGVFTELEAIVSEKFPEALLVVKPHPSQSYAASSERTIVVEEGAANELIQLSDSCVVVSSTIYALCLLANKPLLCVGGMDSLFSAIRCQVRDATELLPALREIFWSDCAPNYSADARAEHLRELLDDQLIACAPEVPAKYKAKDLGEFIAVRAGLSRFGERHRLGEDYARISQSLFEDISSRTRYAFTPSATPVNRPITVVMPIYSDYEGTKRAFELVDRHRYENEDYRVILVWDRGPDTRLLDLCRFAVAEYGFILMENVQNVGFSGSVNRAINGAGRDDIILLNSDTVTCDDWALRLQAAAYAHPKLAAVVPFSNNATIFNVPFPSGTALPPNAIEWTRTFDLAARNMQPCVIEMPVAHGFCPYIKREAFDRVGLFDEMSFGIGQGEDNDFSLRLRSSGYYVGCATNVFVGHDGSTSFGEEAMSWKLNGRKVMNGKYPLYMDEVRRFLANDPLADIRRELLYAAGVRPDDEGAAVRENA